MKLRIPPAIVAALVFGGLAPAQGLTAAQGRLLEEARAAALNYSKWLPNLICTEKIRRFADWDGSGNWVTVDTLTAQVTYFERAESYKVVARNSHPANQKLENVAGAISRGEFGSLLRWIFDPAAMASFEWKGQETIRRRKTWVFAYRVDRAGSRLELRALANSDVTGFHGTVYIDDE